MNSIGLKGFGCTLRTEHIAYKITGTIKSLKDEA